MKGRRKYRRPAVLMIALGLVGIIPRVSAAESRSQTLSDVGITPHIGEQVPADVVLRDTDGSEVALSELFGSKPVILTPVYYRCPMLCGLELNGLVRSLRAMNLTVGEDFDVVTFSIDPRESPDLAAKKKANYLAQYGRAAASSGWRFFTGDKSAIDRLCKSIGFRAKYNSETGQYAHGAGIVVLTPEGRISRYFYGVEFVPRELRLALVEASTGKLGTATDQVLLFCYAYDPTTGRYGLAIMNLVRAGGMLTVLAIVIGIGWMLKRERRGEEGAGT